jgi:tetratricopeptide (TPR) repeat protein
MRWPVLLLVVLPGLAGAEVCPPAPDIAARTAPLMAAVRVAPDPVTARALTGELFKLWALAPDARAQELLDNGMERRAAYDFTRARAFLDELVAYCPAYAEGWNQRAFVYFLTADYALALEDLEVALDLAPDHIAAKAGLALTLMNLGRMEAGQAVLREALALNPWLPERGMLLPEPGPGPIPEGEEL